MLFRISLNCKTFPAIRTGLSESYDFVEKRIPIQIVCMYVRMYVSMYISKKFTDKLLKIQKKKQHTITHLIGRKIISNHIVEIICRNIHQSYVPYRYQVPVLCPLKETKI